MSFMDPERWGHAGEFAARFGDDNPSLEQIRALQAELAPVLLRRMKEDVENLPEKEEVVIWVEMTPEQRKYYKALYYKALYSKQIGSLLSGGASKNLPGMRNLAMELRKLCCHPYLCEGLEDDMRLGFAVERSRQDGAPPGEGPAPGWVAQSSDPEVDGLVRGSGKMLLLHKLLPKLRAEGRQVLVFSQFKIMLNVVEDYLSAAGYPFERIDGDTKQRDRQAAIDRRVQFMNVGASAPASRGATHSRTPTPGPGGDGGGDADGGAKPESSAAGPGQEEKPFVFLLSTRAGGQGITLTSADTVIIYDSDWNPQGITLTSADTVIIYDSDWNPQNDLQAMARCHRIGQTSDVTVYRLVTRGTYEQELFQSASRKYGLDEAVLGFTGGGDNPENDAGPSDNPENDAARIAQLLKQGAHALADDGAGTGGGGGGGGAGGAGAGFASEGIEQARREGILSGRSEKRQLGSRKGNTFSTATFGAGGSANDDDAYERAEQARRELEESRRRGGEGADAAREYWSRMLPEAVEAFDMREAERIAGPVVEGKRARKVLRGYNEDAAWKAASRRATGSDDSDSDGGGGGKRRRRGGGRDEDSGGGGDGDEGEFQEGKRKAGRWARDEPEDDPTLGRPVAAFSKAEADAAEKALLRFGGERPDVIIKKAAPALERRQEDEVKLFCAAFCDLVEAVAAEVAPLEPRARGRAAARPSPHAPAPDGGDAAGDAAGAAGGDGSPAAAAAAAAAARAADPAVLREKLEASGVAGRLPPCARRALLAADRLKNLGRQAHAYLGLLAEHRAVHALLTGARAAADAEAAAVEAAAAAGGGAPGKVKRRTWGAKHDDRLVWGSYLHGYLAWRQNASIEAILTDETLGFPSWIAPAPAPGPDAAAGPDGATPAAPPRPAPAAGALGGPMEACSREEWVKFCSKVGTRLRSLRAAVSAPNYEAPPPVPTPSKPKRPAGPPGAPPAGAGGARPGAAHALDLGGRPPGGGGKPGDAVQALVSLLAQSAAARAAAAPPASAAQAALAARATATAAAGRTLQAAAATGQAEDMRRAVGAASFAELGQMLTAKALAAAAAKGVAPGGVAPAAAAAKRPAPPAAAPPAKRRAAGGGGGSDSDVIEVPQEGGGGGAWPPQQQSKAAPRQGGGDVVDLIEDSSDDDFDKPRKKGASGRGGAAAAGGSAPAPAAAAPPAPPAAGLVVTVRRGGGSQADDGRVEDVEESEEDGGGGPPPAAPPLSQLMGDPKAPGGGAAAAQAAGDHPVYGGGGGSQQQAGSGKDKDKGGKKPGGTPPGQQSITKFFSKG
ncbi:MAG: hypothetical protein J3K34DRAFT_501179 [Monoraphidium minutum]|nr:MAG: hypothetical protein J3K34DRAFT_501179 [Monoraphidium minutum]